MAATLAHRKSDPGGDKVRVYVALEVVSVDGYADPLPSDLRNSADDLRYALGVGWRGPFVFSASREDADAVVEVLERWREKTGSVTAAAARLPFNAGVVASAGEDTRPVVSARLIARDHVLEMTASAATWGDAAYKLAEQVRRFIEINEARLLEERALAEAEPDADDGDCKPPARLEASVWFSGTEFMVKNEGAAAWGEPEFKIKGGMDGVSYSTWAASLEPGATVTVSGAEFARSDGVRFDPAQLKPSEFTITTRVGGRLIVRVFSW